jgi:phosphoribosylformimino-5-aminoimidazole carboxamide ribotide isomerase
MTQRNHEPERVFELLPAVDLRGGRVVRLLRGDFRRETIYDSDPLEVARRFADAGVRWLHVVDLDGARDPGRRQVGVVAGMVAGVGEHVQVEVAGGLRDEGAIGELLAAGAARAVVGTAALAEPAFARRLVDVHGADRVAVALDVRDGLAVGHGWLPGAGGVPVADALQRLADQGVTTFEVTAIDRDGTMSGPDLPLLERLVGLGRGGIIASAGITTLEDLLSVRDLGCSGAIIGRALYEGRLSIGEAIAQLTHGPGPSRRGSGTSADREQRAGGD